MQDRHTAADLYSTILYVSECTGAKQCQNTEVLFFFLFFLMLTLSFNHVSGLSMFVPLFWIISTSKTKGLMGLKGRGYNSNLFRGKEKNNGKSMNENRFAVVAL